MEKQFTRKKLFFVQALSNIHCGTGQGVGDIDLPTAKEAATSFPLIPGSTLKGVLRDYFSHNGNSNKILTAAFGPDFGDDDAEAYASALMITDARILLLPVRAFAGVFAYVTCPLVLSRFALDLGQVEESVPSDIPQVESGQAMIPAGSENQIDGNLLLEELDLRVVEGNEDWKKWCDYLKQSVFEKQWAASVAGARLALVNNDVFSFLCETALPVTARIKLNKETGTVQPGALWYEESMPAETVLGGLVAATDSFTRPKLTSADILKDFATGKFTLQLGGMATTGKGLCHIRFTG